MYFQRFVSVLFTGCVLCMHNTIIVVWHVHENEVDVKWKQNNKTLISKKIYTIILTTQ